MRRDGRSVVWTLEGGSTAAGFSLARDHSTLTRRGSPPARLAEPLAPGKPPVSLPLAAGETTLSLLPGALGGPWPQAADFFFEAPDSVHVCVRRLP